MHRTNNTKPSIERDGIIYTGKPNCKNCGGKGIVRVDDSPIGKVRPCECTVVAELLANLERGWKGLRFAQNIQSRSPLLDVAKSGESCWITADNDVFRSHIKHVALRMNPNWKFLVKSDADLLSAWLASVPLSGMRVLDPEIAMRLSEHAPVSMDKLTLVDLVQPPDVLIVMLGVKAARNSALPEVLHEAITLRTHHGKPIWLVDQPTRPFGESHRAWSSYTRMEMRDFDRVVLHQQSMSHQESPTNHREKSIKKSLPSVEEITTINSTNSRNRLRFTSGSGGTKPTQVDKPIESPPKRNKRNGWKK